MKIQINQNLAHFLPTFKTIKLKQHLSVASVSIFYALNEMQFYGNKFQKIYIKKQFFKVRFSSNKELYMYDTKKKKKQQQIKQNNSRLKSNAHSC